MEDTGWRRNKYGGLFNINENYQSKQNDTNQYMNEKIRESVIKANNHQYNIPQSTLDKFKNREDGNYYVATIKPEHFLKITSNENLIKSIEEETKSYGSFDINKMNKGYAMLEVDLETGKVISHEGRHRMQLLKQNNYDTAQIIIMSKSHSYDQQRAHNMSSLHLTHQMNGEPFVTSVVDLKILNKKE